jgi:ABC-type dipeptide/oligopeptide/nickel transport system permease component
MSQATASFLVVLVLFVLAVYTGIAPPAGFEELPYRIILPFVLIAVGFVQLENLRMRAHMAELIGAIRTAVG